MIDLLFLTLAVRTDKKCIIDCLCSKTYSVVSLNQVKANTTLQGVGKLANEGFSH